MVCKYCGHKLENDDIVCSKCGTKVNDSEPIQITYEDEEVEYVDPPIITEAHTFIDEESFAKKLEEGNKKKEEVDESFVEDDKKNPLPIIVALIIIIVLGLVGYFVVLPNITSNSNKTPSSENNTFTNEDWTSGEFMIDGDFYQLNKPFTKFYDKNWNFEDTDVIKKNLHSGEETEDILIKNSFNKSSITIRLINKNDKDTNIKDCLVWSISVDNTGSDDYVEFTLPGQITNGSKELEIESLYGKLEDDDITRDEVALSTTYHYSVDDKKELNLVIFDNGGLKAFEYRFK